MTDTQASQLAALYNQLVLYEGDKVLLWTNPSPTSSFAAQTITISNASQYRYIIITQLPNTTYYPHLSDPTYSESTIIQNTNGIRFLASSGGTYWRVANIIVSGTSVSVRFEIGHYGSGEDNSSGIPVYIYGI